MKRRPERATVELRALTAYAAEGIGTFLLVFTVAQLAIRQIRAREAVAYIVFQLAGAALAGLLVLAALSPRRRHRSLRRHAPLTPNVHSARLALARADRGGCGHVPC